MRTELHARDGQGILIMQAMLVMQLAQKNVFLNAFQNQPSKRDDSNPLQVSDIQTSKRATTDFQKHNNAGMFCSFAKHVLSAKATCTKVMPPTRPMMLGMQILTTVGTETWTKRALASKGPTRWTITGLWTPANVAWKESPQKPSA